MVKEMEVINKLKALGIHAEGVDVPKNNGVVLRGLQIGGEETNVKPILYLDDFWDSDGMVAACVTLSNEKPIFDMNKAAIKVSVDSFILWLKARRRWRAFSC